MEIVNSSRINTEVIEEMLSDFGRKTEDVVRFLGFSTLCKRTREERGLTIKDVSRELKVPQYRLKAIEEKMVEQILPDVLNQYVDFLGLQECFEKWAENNPAVYQKIVDKQK